MNGCGEREPRERDILNGLGEVNIPRATLEIDSQNDKASKPLSRER